MHVSSLPKAFTCSGPAEIRTRDILDRERTLYRYATQLICGGYYLVDLP